MTSQEAFRGLRKIEGIYAAKFLPADIAPIWSRLLELPESALAHTIGEMKMIWQRMPTTREVLNAVEGWSKRLDTAQVIQCEGEAQENFALVMGFLTKQISETQYIAALFEMSRKWGNPEYAADAADRQERL